MVMANLAVLLAGRGAEVRQLCMRTPKHHDRATTGLPPPGITTTQCPVDTRPTATGALLNVLFSRAPYHVIRHGSATFRDALNNALQDEEHDVIQFESVYLLQYLPLVRAARPRTPVVLRAQNAEHEIWQGLAWNAPWPLSAYHRSQALRIQRFEERSVKAVDHVLALTTVDAELLRTMTCRNNVHVVPMGIEDGAPTHSPEPAGSFFHLAAMNWLPNVEGVRWFLREAWPAFIHDHPDAQLHLAGTGMPKDLLESNLPNVFTQAHVDDPVGYMAGRGVMVVPLLSGSGIRVKILEGMRAGKAVISTRKGAQGIECQHGHDILLADSPAEMIGAMKRCMEEPDLVSRLGRNARMRIKRCYAAPAIADGLQRFYGGILNGRS